MWSEQMVPAFNLEQTEIVEVSPAKHKAK